MRRVDLATCVLCASLGCSGPGQPPVVDDTPSDSGSMPAPAPWTAPAAHAPMPHVVDYGGPVLASPRIQPVVFAGDAMQSDIAAFTAQLGGTGYWTAVSREYGVGAITAA